LICRATRRDDRRGSASCGRSRNRRVRMAVAAVSQGAPALRRAQRAATSAS